MSDETEAIEDLRRAVDENTGVLRGIEGILDDIAVTLEQINDYAAELAWRSLPWWTRVATSWRNAKDQIRLTEQEAKQAAPTLFPE